MWIEDIGDVHISPVKINIDGDLPENFEEKIRETIEDATKILQEKVVECKPPTEVIFMNQEKEDVNELLEGVLHDLIDIDGLNVIENGECWALDCKKTIKRIEEAINTDDEPDGLSNCHCVMPALDEISEVDCINACFKELHQSIQYSADKMGEYRGLLKAYFEELTPFGLIMNSVGERLLFTVEFMEDVELEEVAWIVCEDLGCSLVELDKQGHSLSFVKEFK